jgi:hypothetical protein
MFFPFAAAFAAIAEPDQLIKNTLTCTTGLTASALTTCSTGLEGRFWLIQLDEQTLVALNRVAAPGKRKRSAIA